MTEATNKKTEEDILSFCKAIEWKEDYLSSTAYCGDMKIGFIKKSLSKKELYYSYCLLGGLKLKNEQPRTIDKAKEAVVNMFKHFVKNIKA